MKHKLFCSLGLIVLVMAGFATSPAEAQTTAPGPYYATPSWDQQLPASTRFIVLSNWGGAAVLDRETGLVWERSPSMTLETWYNAFYVCYNKSVGGRKGWHLPTIEQLASLVDPMVGWPGPALPSGHPFNSIGVGPYWSATTWGSNPDFAFFLESGTGDVLVTEKTIGHYVVWCVRGGQGYDGK